MELKHVEYDDFDFYYTIKCERSAIEWGGWNLAPNKKSLFLHYTTFLKGNPNEGRLFVLQDQGRSVGYIQYTFFERETEIAVGIAEQERGRGYASKGICLALQKICGDKRATIAWIREDNIASQKAFKRNDFVRTDEKKLIYIQNLNDNVWMDKYVRIPYANK